MFLALFTLFSDMRRRCFTQHSSTRDAQRGYNVSLLAKNTTNRIGFHLDH
jgi:hypothetical protein